MVSAGFIQPRLANASVVSPPDKYVPFGPSGQVGTGAPGAPVKSILFKYFSTELQEFQALQLKQVDLTDWALTPSFITTFCGDTTGTFACTSAQGEFGVFGIQDNLADCVASTLCGAGGNLWWGLNPKDGVGEGARQLRQLWEHLIDKQTFINNDPSLLGRGAVMDTTVPVGKTATAANFHLYDDLGAQLKYVERTFDPTNLASQQGAANPNIGPNIGDDFYLVDRLHPHSRVAAGDLRLSAHDGFAAGSTVAAGEVDVGRDLRVGWPIVSYAGAASGVVATNPIYLDNDKSGTVTAKDQRVTMVTVFAAGTTVLALKNDAKIKFVDTPPATTPDAPGTWATGKTVIYDADSSGTYTQTAGNPDIVISGTAPALFTNLSIDSKIRYEDVNNNNVRDSGDSVAYDSNNNSLYDTGETIIAGTTLPDADVGTVLLTDSFHGKTESSAFNAAVDAAQTPAVNSPDWIDGLDHLALAFSQIDVAGSDGRTLVTDVNHDGIIDHRDIDQNGDGIVDAAFQPTTMVKFFIRNDDPIRLNLGTTLMNAINQMMGKTVLTPTFADIKAAIPVVFSTATVNDWQMYTYGYGLPGPFWDFTNPQYNSFFASNFCIPTAPVVDIANDYTFYCNKNLDPILDKIQFPGDASSTTSVNNLKVAEEILGGDVADVTVYAKAFQNAYLQKWKGVAQTTGIGITAPNTFLDAYDSTSPGGSTLLTWAQKQGTSTLSWFQLSTVWEFQLALEMYDSLLNANPYKLDQITNWMANSFQSFLDPTATQLGYAPPAGTVQTLRFELRHDLTWHDSVPVTADDVSFSLKNYKTINPFCCGFAVIPMIDVTILGPFLFDLHMAKKSFTHFVNIGGLPIIPRHIWDTADLATGFVPGTGVVDTAKTKRTYDPMSSKIYSAGQAIPVPLLGVSITLPRDTFGLVGSGSFVCDVRDAAGNILTIGGGPTTASCSSSGTSSTSLGDSVVVHAFDSDFSAINGQPQYRYMRTPERFRQWNWADVTNNLRVDSGDVAQFALASGCRNTLNAAGSQGGIPYTFAVTRPCEKPGVPVSFTATWTGGGPADGTWAFGDTATMLAANGATVTHPYAASGFFSLTFTPTGGTPISVLSLTLRQVRIFPFTVTSSITGAQTQTDWSYWDKFGSATGGPNGIVDSADKAIFVSYFRVAWVALEGGTPPGLPTGVWDTLVDPVSGNGIAPFLTVDVLP